MKKSKILIGVMSTVRSTRRLHRLFGYVFSRCEEELEHIKRKENAIDMGDMVRKLRLFTEDGSMRQLDGVSFYSSYEFQDSDQHSNRAGGEPS